MPVARYDKSYLFKKLDFKVDEAELLRNIDKMGLNVESNEKNELVLEFQANRPDLISTIGLARAVRYFMRRSRDFRYEVKQEESDYVVNVGKHVARIRPAIAGFVVKNLNMSEQDLLDVINFTEKLSETYGRKRERIATGLHDLKDVKPPFYYDAYEDEEFVPLGKEKKMKFSEVVGAESKGKKYGALGSKESRYVALKDSKGVMSLIPIINSERTRVTTKTKNMFVDVTGTPRYVIERTADMLAANFIDMGCEVCRVVVNYGGRDYSVPKMESEYISIPLEQMEKEIGVEIGFNNVILLANKMGYEAALVGTKIRFTVPPYRLDVINEQDVIEDIAVAYGYDYIQPVSVPSVNEGKLATDEQKRESVSEAMLGLGFSESMNSYLTNETANFKWMRTQEGDDYIKIANPKASTINMFRTWLLPSLLSNIGKSMHDKLPIKLFELDMAFSLKGNDPQENYHLAAVSCDSGANFNNIKAAVEGLGKRLGAEFKISKHENASFIEGRCASIEVDKRVIGFLGEVHPEVLTNFGIEEPVVGFEIDLREWIK